MYRFLLILILFPISIFSQRKLENDTLKTKKIEKFFSNKDLKRLDSLLLKQKFNASFTDTIDFVLKDKELKDSTSFELKTDLLKTRLEKLNENTPFNLAYNPSLEKMINGYLTKRRKQFPELMSRAKYYFPMFEKYLDKYDIPLEMKYLAVVESALIPTIKSRAGATGLWQFMYGTGIQYNLKVTSYVDERQDPIKSTIAACEYLSRLYKIFGDWDLALAAYNSGPGNVLKAIKRAGGYKNYWNIRHYLPRETANYVPAFYATMYIFEYAKEHNIQPNIPKFFDFETDTIHVKRMVGFDQISEIIGLGEDVLTFLNPVYKLHIIPYLENKTHALCLPKSKIFEFIEKEADLYALAKEDDSKREKPLAQNFETKKSIHYKVKSGDNLGRIATKHGVRVSDLKSWNKLKSNYLKVGQRLAIHSKQQQYVVKETTVKPKTDSSIAENKDDFDMYTVQEGDSLWTISKKYKKVSIEDIQKWNNIWSANSLKPGMKLKIFKS